jgi:NADPH:quinone reductase-like Zn-dependent oxidoreductase
VKEITGGKGVDVVLDMVGGDYVPRNLQCLADDGRHVSIAVQRGLEATIPIWEMMRKRLTLTGSTLRPRDVAFKSLVADELSPDRLAEARACRGRDDAEAGDRFDLPAQPILSAAAHLAHRRCSMESSIPATISARSC